MKEFIVPTEIPEEIEFYEEHKCKEIVRCKDCAYYINGDGCGNVDGDSPARNLIDVKPDWFCADGEHK